jgi:hypothetical protein
LGLALDGVNPYVDLSTNYSTWLVLLFNYILPPWLTTKRFFVMLILLILGKESIKNKNIDVYLQPLVEELEELWKEMKAYDVTRPKRLSKFMLRAIWMWSLHDYLMYGLFASYQTKGYLACPLCSQKWILNVPYT